MGGSLQVRVPLAPMTCLGLEPGRRAVGDKDYPWQERELCLEDVLQLPVLHMLHSLGLDLPAQGRR